MLYGAALLAGTAAAAVDPRDSVDPVDSLGFVGSIGPVSAGLSPDAAASQISFDIPAQPLTDALRAYSTLTRRATLFRSDMTDDKTSSPVHGRYSAPAALQQLLAGTGLSAEEVGSGPAAAFVLKDSRTAPATAAGAESSAWTRVAGGDAGGVDYAAVVQDRVWRALCADSRTAPGQYRSLLRFQVDATGKVQRARLLGSTGDARRDTAMLETLRQLRIDSAPPPGFPQPLTLFIVPHDPANGGAEPRCEESHRSSRPGHGGAA